MRRTTLFAGVRAPRELRARRFRLGLEILEDRLLPSGNPLDAFAGFANPGVELASAGLMSPAGGTGQPYGFSPQQISQAYGFNLITFNNGSVAGNGASQTIAIIDAYNQPNIAGDLQAFDSMYGLPAPPNFRVVNQNGGGPLPATDTGWGLEISLDVEWAHAVAPQANILLVEANSNSTPDLLAAVNYARNQPNVSVVSMSWGGGEWSDEASYDSYFTTPAGHTGVTFVASSGDNGSGGAPLFPSISTNVLAVGGTQLNTDSAGNYQGESAWSGSGGGISAYQSQPGYQRGVVTQTSSRRAVPDVSYDASTSTPFAVYDSSGYSGWLAVGGTSAGAPQWAGLLAIANQGRALAGEGTLDGATQTLPMLYQLPQSDFHDVLSGSNGGYLAGTGYDLVTGRGSPLANLVVSGLVGSTSANPPWVVTPASATSNSVTGTTTGLSVRGNDDGGAGSLTYTWSVLSGPAGAAAPTFTVNGSNAAQNTTALFSQAGTYTFQVAIRDAAGLAVTSDVTVTVNQTWSSVLVTPGSSSVSTGGVVQLTALARDQFGNAMSQQPTWTWTLSGPGSLSGNGVYVAPSAGSGNAVVQASAAGMSGSASVSFAAPTPPPSSPPSPPSPPVASSPWAAWLRLIDQFIAQFSYFQSFWQSLFGGRPSAG